LVWVPGTGGEPYLFGRAPSQKAIHIAGFHIPTTPVTQALWTHVMGTNPASKHAPRCPVENISWRDITRPGGFLDQLNECFLPALIGNEPELHFRLPPRRNGNTRREAAQHGATTSRSAEATIRMKSPGMGRAGPSADNCAYDCWARVWGGGLPVAGLAADNRPRLTTPLRRRPIRSAFTTCPATCGSGVMTCASMISAPCRRMADRISVPA
jgi:hypothetical protein